MPFPDAHTVSKRKHSSVNTSLVTFLTASEDNCFNTTVILDRPVIYAAEASFYHTGVLPERKEIIIEIFLVSKSNVNWKTQKTVISPRRAAGASGNEISAGSGWYGAFWFGTKGRQVLYKIQAARQLQ